MVVNFLTKMWYPPTYICPDQTDNMTAEVRFNNILKRRTKEFEALKIQSSIVVISTKRESEKSRNVYFLNRDYSPQHDVELQSNSGEYSHRNPNCEPGTHCTCEIKQTLKFWHYFLQSYPIERRKCLSIFKLHRTQHIPVSERRSLETTSQARLQLGHFFLKKWVGSVRLGFLVLMNSRLNCDHETRFASGLYAMGVTRRTRD